MLVDPKFTHDPVMSQIFSALGGSEIVRVSTGIYTGVQHNFSNLIDKSWDMYRNGPKNMNSPEGSEYYKWMYELPNDMGHYGVCDSVQQFQDKFAQALDSDPASDYCVGLDRVRRDEQPASGGWRWHKWGEYVGVQKPTTEYIYNEPLIEEVWCFSICKRKRQI